MINAFEKLGNTLNSRMQGVQKSGKDLAPEIGTITGGYGIKIGSVSNTIPRGEYLVSSGLKLKSGDRVLLVWCGYEPVVVAVLENS